MKYVEQNLIKGEKIMYSTKLHLVTFLVPVILFLTGIYLHLSGYTSILLYLSILSGISSFINYKTTEFSLTDKRVIGKTGFIKRKSIDLLLNKVESIKIDQDILGRLLNYGSVIVTGTGATKETFPNITDPLKLRAEVNNIL